MTTTADRAAHAVWTGEPSFADVLPAALKVRGARHSTCRSACWPRSSTTSVLVTDDELYSAMRLLLVEAHIVAEARAPHRSPPRAGSRNGSRASASRAGSAEGNATADSLRRALERS